MEFIFWLSLLGCAYSYLIYPALLLFISARQQSTHIGDATQPKVTIVITVHNEITRIDKKLFNTLAIDYPKDRFQIIVASDASSDGTDEIVERHKPQGVVLVRAEARKGKEHAQSLAIQAATGDIIVFTDAGTEIPGGCLHSLVMNFINPKIGAVSSEDRFLSRDGSLVGEGAYVKYEMWLRRLESDRAGLVGLSGSFFAARRGVCALWDVQSPSDFNTAISCARSGMVAVTDPSVIGYYTDIKDESKEYSRKLRTILRGISGLARHTEVLNPFRFGLFSFQVWSHKVMRWLVPWFMLTMFASSLALHAVHEIYQFSVIAQVLGYSAILAAHFSSRLRRNVVLRIGYFFVQVNLAIAHATVLYISGRRMTVWEPSKR